MEELVGEVAEHGGAAGRDASPGDLNDEAGEEFLDILAGREFGEFREEVGGKILRVIGSRRERESERTEMARTETRLGLQAGEAATLAIGKEIQAAGGVVLRQNGDFGGGAIIGSRRVHEFFFLGYTLHTPGILYRYQKKRVTEFDGCKWLKTKGGVTRACGKKEVQSQT